MNYYQKYQKYRFKYLNLLNQSGGSTNTNNNVNVTPIPSQSQSTNNNVDVTIKNNENENDKIKRIIDDYNKNSKISEDFQVILDLKKKITDEKDSKTFDEILKIKKLNINDQNNLLNMGIYNRKIKLSQNEIDENQKSKDEKVNEKDNLIQKLKELNDTNFNEIIDSKVEGKEYYNSLIKYIIDKYTKDNVILNIDSDLILFIASYARNSELEQDLFEILKIKQYDNKTQSEILFKSRSDRTKFLNQSGGYHLKDVDVKKITADEYYEICREAVTQKGYMLQHIDITKISKDKYFEICVIAIKQNTSALRFINKEVIDNYKYTELCEIAVIYTSDDKYRNKDVGKEMMHYIFTKALDHNGKLLILVNKDYFDVNDYFDLCRTAIRQNTLLLLEIEIDDVKHPANYYYNTLCEIAVKNTSDDKTRNKNILFNDIYLIYKKALKQNGNLLEFVNKDLIIKNENMYELCKIAVQQNSDALKYIANKGLSNEQINELWNIAKPGKEYQLRVNKEN